jgi:Flavodoxins
MKKIITLFITFIALVSVVTCSTKENSKVTDSNINKINGKDILIVYFSHSGNTESIAKLIQKETSSTIFEIKTKIPYPSDYSKLSQQAEKEQKENFLPELNEKVKDISKYKVIFIGYPIWLGNFPQPIASFLSQHQLSNKIIIPFSTSGAGSLANSVKNLKKLTPNSTFLDGISISEFNVNSSQKEVNNWLKKINIKK